MLRIADGLTKHDLLAGKFGVEREAIRVNVDGTIAKTPHPETFGDKQENPYITTDFAEAQVEMVTPAMDNLEAVHNYLTMICDVVTTEIKEELLWPYSMPPELIASEKIQIAKFSNTDKGCYAREYREYLQGKYGSARQLVSGIHYNFSFSDDLISKLWHTQGQEVSFRKFKDAFYLKIARNYTKYHWFLTYFLGASPIMHESYENENYLHATSLRNSQHGYQNIERLELDFSTAKSYVNSIKKHMESNVIIDEREIYTPVRLKHSNKAGLLDALVEDGIQYLEIRSIDLNPFEIAGISLDDLRFIHLFMIMMTCEFDHPAHIDPEIVALHGKSGCQEIQDGLQKMLTTMQQINEQFQLGMDTILVIKNDQLNHPELLPSSRIADDFVEYGYTKFPMMRALYHRNVTKNREYNTYSFETMELSTQLLIAGCIKRGINFEILDHAENFLRLTKNSNIQLVKQATKTALDSYVTYLAMENKEVTKRILESAGIPTPKGAVIARVSKDKTCADEFLGKSVVVKPKSTNYGIGITILKNLDSCNEFKKALDIAFSHDEEVIVEEFIPGQEFRFLVVGEEIVAVMKRVPANVIGDGKSTIYELIEDKNDHPWRGTDHKAPFETIVIDDIVKNYLKAQDLDENSVPANGQQIFLRENSNISTGGDSVDVTDEMSDFFKKKAILSAKAADATLCGVDMIIEHPDDEQSDYSFIELNFNPAIHMHAFPYSGTPRNAIPYVLDALGF